MEAESGRDLRGTQPDEIGASTHRVDRRTAVRTFIGSLVGAGLGFILGSLRHLPGWSWQSALLTLAVWFVGGLVVLVFGRPLGGLFERMTDRVAERDARRGADRLRARPDEPSGRERA